MANNIETILSPALINLYELQGKAVVVIDILRATTSMCVAFQHGAKQIIPVDSPEKAKLLQDAGMLAAAERNAIKLEGFDFGNSPFEFQNEFIKHQSIAFTTTNGTKAIQLAQQQYADDIIIGSFLNLDAVALYLKKLSKPVVLLCSAWKDKVNIEDTLYAGALAGKLLPHFDTTCDSTSLAINLYQMHQQDLVTYVRTSSHARRFTQLHLHTDDVNFCLQHNTTAVVPILKDNVLCLATSVL
jgi:2-phosphosulfolactate phosphatase